MTPTFQECANNTLQRFLRIQPTDLQACSWRITIHLLQVQQAITPESEGGGGGAGGQFTPGDVIRPHSKVLPRAPPIVSAALQAISPPRKNMITQQNGKDQDSECLLLRQFEAIAHL